MTRLRLMTRLRHEFDPEVVCVAAALRKVGRTWRLLLRSPLLVGCAISLAAVIALNTVLFYGPTPQPFFPSRDGALIPCPRTPSYSLNPLPLVFNRCGLGSSAIAKTYAAHRPLAIGWSMTLLASGGSFIALGIQTVRSRNSRSVWVSSLGFLGFGVSMLIAAFIALVLLVETQDLAKARFTFLGEYGKVLSSATLAITTWNPFQQVLVFAVAPAALAVAISGHAFSLRTVGRFRTGIRYTALLCAVLLLAGLAAVVFPNTALRISFAVGLGTAPFLLALLALAPGDHEPRHQTVP